MIQIYGFGEHFGITDPSAFVLKVMTYMRMVNIPYTVNTKPDNLRKSPKGKLPFIDDSGQQVADSYFIIKHVNAQYQVQLDSHLNAEQLAQIQLLSQSLDEGLYWCVVYSRWMNDTSWPRIKHAFFSEFPIGLKQLIPIIARKSVKNNLHGQGFGRHSDKEIMLIAEHNLQSLSDLLSENNYFFGNQVCSFDAVAYGHLAQLILTDFNHPINKLAREFDNLVHYCERIQKQYFLEQAHD